METSKKSSNLTIRHFFQPIQSSGWSWCGTATGESLAPKEMLTAGTETSRGEKKEVETLTGQKKKTARVLCFWRRSLLCVGEKHLSERPLLQVCSSTRTWRRANAVPLHGKGELIPFGPDFGEQMMNSTIISLNDIDDKLQAIWSLKTSVQKLGAQAADEPVCDHRPRASHGEMGFKKRLKGPCQASLKWDISLTSLIILSAESGGCLHGSEGRLARWSSRRGSLASGQVSFHLIPGRLWVWSLDVETETSSCRSQPSTSR